MEKRWQIAPKVEGGLVRQLLANRGLRSESEIDVFLHPSYDQAISPFAFIQMKRAVERIFTALEKGEKIVIHGDYDADGTCGSTLLFGAISDLAEKMGLAAKLEVFLPDRERDGYGVALHTVERLAGEGTNLLITVDCGISNDVPLDRARELGVDVIICDHHQLGEKLPEGAIILHPLAPGEIYANKHLCGTGVAFKLASGLIEVARARGLGFPEGYEKWWLDLVAVATVTDVMPLLGENRILELFGLRVLNKTRRPGLRKIIEYCRSKIGELDTESIGFQIGPRINAAGRLKSALIAFRALSAKTEAEAEASALELEQLNRERQRISDAAFAEAKVMIGERQSTARVHVVWSETWLPGVVGLVAGKITNEFGVPSFALTKVGEHFVGSGRSAGGFHLVEAMRACGDIFIKAGGHPEACGLTLASIEQVQIFQEKISLQADAYFEQVSQEQTIEIDAELPLEQIDWELYEQLASFEPYGQKNPKPTFCVHGVEVSSADRMGNTGSHLRLVVKTPAGQERLVGFGFGDLVPGLTAGTRVDLAYQIEINEWNGRQELQARIIDIRVKK